MKTLNYLHLEEAAACKVVEGLKQLLADYQNFYTNLRGFHWNIKGHDFFVLHSKFEEMYDDTAAKIDEIAERMLMLDGQPDNRFSEYLKTAKIQEITNVSCGDQALKNVLETYSYLIGEERKVLATAQEASDESTAAMLSDYIKGQEKLVWMLVAYYSGECKK